MRAIYWMAVVDVKRNTVLGLSVLRRHVGWFESKCARARGLRGKDRSRYQRAFHRALNQEVKP